MKPFRVLLKRRRLRDSGGATAVEYAMVAALISIAIIGGATLVGQAMAAKFQYVADTVAAVRPN
jgi:pilus assembly protein Flp/PilA